MNLNQLIKIEPNTNIENFSPGDTVRVSVKVTEGDRTRIQNFEGTVIRKRGGGTSSTFTVRRVAQEVGVERTFPLYGPNVDAVKVLRRGDVRRSRLYYLRGRSGKRARIKEKR
ncbi:MAG: large subunit ribosomal protein L19 [Chloroflexi bacterium]|nr:MAG: large subunit ribosomal protein L19 [Chloroflexota bacterium]